MRNSVLTRRVAALLTVAAFAAYLLLFGCPHYDLGDDSLLLDSLMGAVGGVQESFNHHVLYPLFGLLHLFSRAIPDVAWFSVCQLVMLVIGAYVTVSSGMRLAQKGHLPVWLGWLLGSVWAWIFIVPFGNFISFTQTAVVMGMAAVWQAACIDWKSREKTVLLVRSILWLLLAFCLRWESALSAVCFWAGVLLCAVLLEKARPCTVLTGGVVCAAVLGLAMGVHAAAAIGEAEYERFQTARISVVDYGALYTVDEDTLSRIGWTDEDVALAADWFLLDSAVNAEALEIIAEEAPKDFSLTDALQRIRTLVQKNRNLYWIGMLAALLLAAAFAAALLSPKVWRVFAPLGCAAGAGVLMLYLALKGRLPMRAASAVMWPACTVGVYLAVHNGAALVHRGGLRRVMGIGMAFACAVVLIPNARQAFSNSYQPYPMPRESVYMRLEEYALAHPEQLVIASNSLGRDPRLFPERRAGLAPNLLMGWGSWNNHSAGYRALFANFGYAHDQFTLQDLVDSAIRLAVPENEELPQPLLDVIGKPVACGMEKQEGFRIYRLTSK